MNICLTDHCGKSFIIQLKRNFDQEDFRNVLQKYFSNINMYRFIVQGHEIHIYNECSFDRQKYLFKNGINIIVTRRILGGGYVEMEILTGIILSDLEQELLKIPTVYNEDNPCQVCREHPTCFKLCCSRICQSCFISYFESSSFQLKCMICRRAVDLTSFFKSNDFIRSLESLDEIRELMKHIDCQICHCGLLAVNETLYAKQTCQQCKRTFCFFCNKDWNDELQNRHNDLYTCHLNCDYETKLTYELVPLQSNPSLMIPNRRFCPFCFTFGGYDEKCKYHTCISCARSFCFICLEEEDTCKNKYGSNYRHKCTDFKKQHFSDFPTIGKH
jgi:hypothetical protein